MRKQKERPILFKAEMVRAILSGQKTTTRRVVKFNDAGRISLGKKQWHYEDEKCVDGFPLGKPGDHLWVRETWQIVPSAGGGYCIYGANYSEEEYKNLQPWKPSIHQFRVDSRVLLKITNVRVERLQDISEDDAKAEGAPMIDKQGTPYLLYRSAFMAMWDHINFKRGFGWGKNPFVWVIKFELVAP